VIRQFGKKRSPSRAKTSIFDWSASRWFAGAAEYR